MLKKEKKRSFHSKFYTFCHCAICVFSFSAFFPPHCAIGIQLFHLGFDSFTIIPQPIKLISFSLSVLCFCHCSIVIFFLSFATESVVICNNVPSLLNSFVTVPKLFWFSPSALGFRFFKYFVMPWSPTDHFASGFSYSKNTDLHAD